MTANSGRIVARLLPPESSSLESVSREVGISAATLERWRADALANGFAIGCFPAETNADPRGLRWTKDAAKIVATRKRGHQV
jgi:hypothetical protein